MTHHDKARELVELDNYLRDPSGGLPWEIRIKIADLITALAEENRRLREVLHKIESAPAWGYPDRWETTPAEVRQLARAALSSGGGGSDGVLGRPGHGAIRDAAPL